MVLTVALSASVFAGQLTVIELNHRQADEMIKTIKPLLKEHESITGRGYDIYLNAAPDTTRTVKELINRLDKAPAQLLISVKNNSATAKNNINISVNGSAGNDHVQISTGEHTQKNSVNIDATGHEVSASDHNSQRIRATEGLPALIYTGTSIPVKMIERQRVNGRLIEQETVDYRPVQRGFYVTAWLNGDNVRLELSRQNDTVTDSGAVNLSSIITTAQGKLGEWIPVGGIETSRSNSNWGIRTNSSISTVQHESIAIKVIRTN